MAQSIQSTSFKVGNSGIQSQDKIYRGKILFASFIIKETPGQLVFKKKHINLVIISNLKAFKKYNGILLNIEDTRWKLSITKLRFECMSQRQG